MRLLTSFTWKKSNETSKIETLFFQHYTDLMKKSLLFASFFAFSAALSAQCTADYDFGAEPFGVSPDPLLGETFEIGYTSEPYEDVIHIKVPTDASDIDETLPQGAPIDSVQLITVAFDLDGTAYTLEEMGLEIECNNNGDSPDPCTFLGGNQYCATLSGNPTTPGVFGLSIEVLGFTTVFGIVIEQEVIFDQYTITIENGSNVANILGANNHLGQSYPNPATDQVRIPFELKESGAANFQVVNLLGEVLVSEQIRGAKGSNEFVLNTQNLAQGIYLYTMEVDGKRFTKRMIINR